MCCLSSLNENLRGIFCLWRRDWTCWGFPSHPLVTSSWKRRP
uniref:Uncharacterized protein n=1 Tax=Anguilla anguilla TaxID=7936 RepID=A0A0E9PMD0_ANGAN